MALVALIIIGGMGYGIYRLTDGDISSLWSDIISKKESLLSDSQSNPDVKTQLKEQIINYSLNKLKQEFTNKNVSETSATEVHQTSQTLGGIISQLMTLKSTENKKTESTSPEASSPEASSPEAMPLMEKLEIQLGKLKILSDAGNIQATQAIASLKEKLERLEEKYDAFDYNEFMKKTAETFKTLPDVVTDAAVKAAPEAHERIQSYTDRLRQTFGGSNSKE